MDPDPYPVTPKRGSQGRTSGTYYINSRRNFYRPRDELVDINFYNENIATDDEKLPSRKICCCICVLAALLVILAAAAFVILTGVFNPLPLGSHCVNASNVSISEFDSFAEKYKKDYNESEVCSKLETFASNFAKYENGSVAVGTAVFGITKFADWSEEERDLADEVDFEKFGDGKVQDIVIGSAIYSPTDNSWNRNGLAQRIVFDDSKSVEENMVAGLLQWHTFNRNYSNYSIIPLGENMTLSQVSLNNDTMTEFKKKLIYFDNYGAFAAHILVPYDIHDYQKGVISECDNVAIMQGIICGYGQVNGSYYWEVQPIGSAWHSWGINGTALISAEDGCSIMVKLPPNIYSIKPTQTDSF